MRALFLLKTSEATLFVPEFAFPCEIKVAYGRLRSFPVSFYWRSIFLTVLPKYRRKSSQIYLTNQGPLNSSIRHNRAAMIT